MIDFLIEIKKDENFCVEKSFLITPRIRIHEKRIKNFNLILWGDPIFDPKSNFKNCSNAIEEFIPEMIQKVQGHYYFLAFDKNINSYYLGNSLFSILPLYYSNSKGKLYISQSAKIIADHLNIRDRNKRFLLENILFNYPLFNQSAFEEINLLPSNSYMHWINGNIRFHKHTKIEDYFTSNNFRQKKSLDHLSELFLERSSLYFPERMYIHALTGGFDGRTLVACAKFHNKQFETYCFGSTESTDTYVAKSLSAQAGLSFNHFELDREYIENQSRSNGLEFILNSSGTASFARAHYLYSAKALSSKSNYLVTGNFGSEIFRAANTSGAVISPNLYRLIQSKNLDEGINSLMSSYENIWLNKVRFQSEWESLIEDLRGLPIFSRDYNHLTLNQKFYIIVFEEVFRKYFGAEMINQFKYIVNRTPFVDFQFITQLLSSPLAGVHSNFFEKNPINRFKGQLLYSYIIRRSYPKFSTIPMNKGYTPNDLTSIMGKLKISTVFLKKKLITSGSINSDPFAVRASFLNNKDLIEMEMSEDNIFNETAIKNAMQGNQTDNSFFIALSQAIYYNNKNC